MNKNHKQRDLKFYEQIMKIINQLLMTSSIIHPTLMENLEISGNFKM